MDTFSIQVTNNGNNLVVVFVVALVVVRSSSLSSSGHVSQSVSDALDIFWSFKS